MEFDSLDSSFLYWAGSKIETHLVFGGTFSIRGFFNLVGGPYVFVSFKLSGPNLRLRLTNKLAQ